MKVIIDIDKETYKNIKEENGIYGLNNELSNRITGKIVEAIQNSTIIPERNVKFVDIPMEYAPTIIEAEKGR